MKRLLLIIPLILAVVLYAGFRTGGYRSGLTTIEGETQFNSKVTFNDASLWMLDDSLFFTDGTAAAPGADTSFQVQTGGYFYFSSDNDFYFDTHIQLLGDFVGTSDARAINWYGRRIYVDGDADDSVSSIIWGSTDSLKWDSIPEAFTLTAPLTVAEGVNYAADVQGNDDYEVDIPGIIALTAGLTVTFKANTLNTDGATLEITSVGDLDAILKNHDAALVTGDIEAGQIIVVVWDGSNWQMTSQLAQ